MKNICIKVIGLILYVLLQNAYAASGMVNTMACEDIGQTMPLRHSCSAKAGQNSEACSEDLDLAFWGTLFGDFIKQKPFEANIGYRTKLYGGLIGIDKKVDDNIFGIAFSLSKAEVNDEINNNFITNVLGYYLNLYGTTYVVNETALDWMISGGFNQNDGDRQLRLESHSNSWYLGGKFSVGNFIDINNNLRFTNFYSLQYSYVNQPPYGETGSITSLHVVNDKNINILTLGAGVKFSIPTLNSWIYGDRDIHAIAYYDVARSKENALSNFTIGSPIFVIINSNERFSMQFGVDYTFSYFDCIQIEFSYDLYLRSRYYDNAGSIKFKVIL